jgi:hypothetical protein
MLCKRYVDNIFILLIRYNSKNPMRSGVLVDFDVRPVCAVVSTLL